MSKFIKYDGAYANLLVVRARVRSVISQIMDEVNNGTPDAINRALAKRADLKSNLALQGAAQQVYLQELDATANPPTNNKLRKVIKNSDFPELDQAYSELLAARMRVENKMVSIDDVLSSGSLDAVAKALAMRPDLVDLLNKQDASQETFNTKLDAMQGKGAPTAISRSAFDNLTPEKRMRFVKAGGKLKNL